MGDPMSGPERGSPWVLISEGTSGESRAAVAAVRALAAAGYRPAVTVSGPLSLAAASRHCARRVTTPPVETQPQAYAEAIRRELAARPYHAFFPGSDAAILALGLPVRSFLDKVECARRAEAAGLRVPPSRVFASAAELLAERGRLDYPLIAKPDVKRRAAIRADSPGALATALAPAAAEAGRVIVQPFLSDGLRGVIGLAWRGRLVEVMHMRYHRIWPLPCGTVAAAETVSPDEELEERLARLLDGYDGVFHADLAGPYLLDLNPRIHAALPLALAAGLNPVARYCDLLRGDDVPTRRAASGVFFRWIEGDVRSTLRSLREGTLSPAGAARALAPRAGTVHGYESLRDPGPLWARVRFAARRLARGRAVGAGTTPGTA